MAKNKITITSIGVVSIIVGLIIFGISLFSLINHKELDGRVEATISDIKREKLETVIKDEDSFSEDEYEYTVFVNYTVDKKEYKNVKYDRWVSTMKVGDKLEVEYDPKDPSKIQSINGKTDIIILMSLGGLITVFGIVKTILEVKSNKDN